jgi:hypothetical protein
MNPDDIENNGDEFVEEEVAAENTSEDYLPDGDYTFVVKSLANGVAQSGFKKTIVHFEVFGGNLKRPKKWQKHFSHSPNAAWTIKNFVIAIDEEQAAKVKNAKAGESVSIGIKKIHIGRQVQGKIVNDRKAPDPRYSADVQKWSRHPDGVVFSSDLAF